jgi:histidine triad (HIT) family protein
MDCVFCKIVQGELPTKIVAENELAIAFRDNAPLTPVHVLVVPRKHIVALHELTVHGDELAGALMRLCAQVAEQEGLLESGYRVLTNAGDDAGQTVHHLHFHVLGGRRLLMGL